MFKHFIFQNGEVKTFEYDAGDQDMLSKLSDRNVQLKCFPEVDELDVYTNPLVHVYESELVDQSLEDVENIIAAQTTDDVDSLPDPV